MDNLYDSAVLVGFTLLIGVIVGLLIAMRNRAPVIQVGERDVESRSIFGAVVFGFGVVFFIGFLYLMVPKEFRFPGLPSSPSEAPVDEEPVRASLELDTVTKPVKKVEKSVAAPKKKPVVVAQPVDQPDVGSRELVIIQSNAFGNVSKADAEVALLEKRYPACKVLIDNKLYHTGYGPFDTVEEAERVKRAEGLSGRVIRFYY